MTLRELEGQGMSDEFDYVSLTTEPEEHAIRVLSFQCARCGVNVVVTGRTAPISTEARDEIRSSAERVHALDSCKVRARD